MARFKITPWEVSGRIDYGRLIRQFGIKPIDQTLLKKLGKYGKLHYFFERGIVFGHRDLDILLDELETGKKVYLYTGRKPSGKMHLGHLLPFMLTKHLQDLFHSPLYVQITDDEKVLTGGNGEDYVFENLLDIFAVGLDQRKTRVIINTKDIRLLYGLAIRIAKHVNFSTVKAVFGFKNTSSIGMIFFPAIQAAPCFLGCEELGKEYRCLIPASPDQDPYWRGIAREVADVLGYPKPAQIYNKILPGITKDFKMSSSIPESCIFTTEPEESLVKKVGELFTGGRATIAEQREKGGNPEVCVVYEYFTFFEGDETEVKKIREDCLSGKLMCGECKHKLARVLKDFINEHVERREKVRDFVETLLR